MRIVVGLSGGVDSSVAAWLLQQEGHEVIGIFMRNWHDESVVIDNECPWIDDANDAMLVASHLGIPFQVLDLSAQYKERIVNYMFDEYAAGRTPNPDVLCNREVKFDLFLKSALELGADGVATGHYCRKDTLEVNGQTTHRLLAGVDTNKDQSYFLCQLTQAQLDKAHFPIGELTKPEVRRLASKSTFPPPTRKTARDFALSAKCGYQISFSSSWSPKQATSSRLMLSVPNRLLSVKLTLHCLPIGTQTMASASGSTMAPIFSPSVNAGAFKWVESQNRCLCSRRMWNAICSS